MGWQIRTTIGVTSLQHWIVIFENGLQTINIPIVTPTLSCAVRMRLEACFATVSPVAKQASNPKHVYPNCA